MRRRPSRRAWGGRDVPTGSARPQVRNPLEPLLDRLARDFSDDQDLSDRLRKLYQVGGALTAARPACSFRIPGNRSQPSVSWKAPDSCGRATTILHIVLIGGFLRLSCGFVAAFLRLSCGCLAGGPRASTSRARRPPSHPDARLGDTDGDIAGCPPPGPVRG